jgi:TorA maturation chaperone TorD
LWTRICTSFLKFSFVAWYEEFQEDFLAEAADHSYDAVYQVVRKTIELFREDGSVERKFGSERLNKKQPGN